MENNTLFITASRNQLRFVTSSGHLSTEDLWSLSLQDLDRIARSINSRIKASDDQESFLENPDRKVSKALEEHKLQLEILKVIIGIRQDENKVKAEATAKRNQRAFLRDLKQRKQIENLEGLSIEDIDKQLAELGED